MEIYQIPRILICEDKPQLSDYEVDDKRSVNYFLYNTIKQNYSIIQDYTALFNDAYYICTLILIDDAPYQHFDIIADIAAGGGKEKEIRKEAVMGMVYKYLTSIDSSMDAKLRRFKEIMHLSLNIDAFQELPHLAPIRLPDSTFAPRKITKELLQNVNLRELTDDYSLDVVLQVTALLAKNTIDKMVIIDAVIKSVVNEKDSSLNKNLITSLRMMKIHLTDPAYNSSREDEKSTEQRMEVTVRDVSEKIGEATVPLKVLVEGIKKRAQIKGIDAATELYDHLNSILYDIPEWHKNVPELEIFFIDAREKREVARKITTTQIYNTLELVQKKETNIGTNYGPNIENNGTLNLPDKDDKQ